MFAVVLQFTTVQSVVLQFSSCLFFIWKTCVEKLDCEHIERTPYEIDQLKKTKRVVGDVNKTVLMLAHLEVLNCFVISGKEQVQ